MSPDEAKQAVSQIETPHYGEWTLLIEGLLYVTCAACGESNSYLHKRSGTFDMVRLCVEDDLTDAARETERYPLYNEVVRLREENIRLKRKVGLSCSNDELDTMITMSDPGMLRKALCELMVYRLKDNVKE